MALAENCCVAEFDDWRIAPALREQVAESMPEGTEWSKRLKMLLVHLEKQNRFIVALNTPDPHPPIAEIEAVRQQASDALLDAIITVEVANECHSAVPEIDILSFAASAFDLARRDHATHGIALAGGEHASADFYRRYLKKVLHHAGKIEFVDRMFGDKYGDHFKYTLRTLVREYAGHCVNPAEFRIHTGNSSRIPHCRRETAGFSHGIKVAVEAYDLDGDQPSLPHERYLLTDQFAWEIGRGLDLFDQDTDRNRDVSISFKNHRKVEGLLTSAASSKIP